MTSKGSAFVLLFPAPALKRNGRNNTAPVYKLPSLHFGLDSKLLKLGCHEPSMLSYERSTFINRLLGTSVQDSRAGA